MYFQLKELQEASPLHVTNHRGRKQTQSPPILFDEKNKLKWDNNKKKINH